MVCGKRSSESSAGLVWLHGRIRESRHRVWAVSGHSLYETTDYEYGCMLHGACVSVTWRANAGVSFASSDFKLR
jgi:hypothetical protein